jgi:hypothetical protein
LKQDAVANDCQGIGQIMDRQHAVIDWQRTAIGSFLHLFLLRSQVSPLRVDQTSGIVLNEMLELGHQLPERSPPIATDTPEANVLAFPS